MVAVITRLVRATAGMKRRAAGLITKIGGIVGSLTGVGVTTRFVIGAGATIGSVSGVGAVAGPVCQIQGRSRFRALNIVEQNLVLMDKS